MYFEIGLLLGVVSMLIAGILAKLVSTSRTREHANIAEKLLIRCLDWLRNGSAGRLPPTLPQWQQKTPCLTAVVEGLALKSEFTERT